MSLVDRWCHVYNPLAEVAQLNNGVTWLRGKHSVLALAAHDLLVFALLIRPWKADERTQHSRAVPVAPTPVSLALKPKQTQPALPASDISMKLIIRLFPTYYYYYLQNTQKQAVQRAKNEAFLSKWGGINWQGIMVSWDGWVFLVRIPGGAVEKKARRNGG